MGKIIGERIFLREVELSDCTSAYLSWLQDPEVNQYLETRWEQQSIESITSFVREMRDSNRNILFAIVETSTKRHIGNIKIGPVNYYHKYADISYFIGDRSSWGKGYASEAVLVATAYAFNDLELESLIAGVYESNIGSQKVLERSGYGLQGRFSKQLVSTNNEKEDHLWYTIRKGDFVL